MVQKETLDHQVKYALVYLLLTRYRVSTVHVTFCLGHNIIQSCCRSPWAPRQPRSFSTSHQNSRREGHSGTTGYPRTDGGERGSRATGSSWGYRSVILMKLVSLSIPEKKMSCSETSTSPVTLQVSWDPLGRRACRGSVARQEQLDSVDWLDKWATPVCKAWKVCLSLWGSLGLGS